MERTAQLEASLALKGKRYGSLNSLDIALVRRADREYPNDRGLWTYPWTIEVEQQDLHPRTAAIRQWLARPEVQQYPASRLYDAALRDGILPRSTGDLRLDRFHLSLVLITIGSPSERQRTREAFYGYNR